MSHPSTDPAVYQEYQSKWASLPTDAEGWIKRAQEVAAVLAPDAAAREKANKTPRAEVALLKHSGLLKILGPKKYGGGEQPWSVASKAIREVAKTDGCVHAKTPHQHEFKHTTLTPIRSIGMLLAYHLLWSTTADVVGSPEQAERTRKLIIENNYFIGGAVNPRDNDLKITDNGDGTVTYTGFKNFTTGAAVSDLVVLEGAVDGQPEVHIFAYVPTDQPGKIDFAHNWDNIGLRLTESGSAKINNVIVPWTDALGWDAATKRPDPAVLGIPFSTLLLTT